MLLGVNASVYTLLRLRRFFPWIGIIFLSDTNNKKIEMRNVGISIFFVYVRNFIADRINIGPNPE